MTSVWAPLASAAPRRARRRLYHRACRRARRQHPHPTRPPPLPQLRETHLPLPVCVCLKERNGGKLHSHLWALLGVASRLNPKYVLLVSSRWENGGGGC